MQSKENQRVDRGENLSDMESFFLCNGDETQGIVKPTGAHDSCFQRFIGMICTRKLGISERYSLAALLQTMSYPSSQERTCYEETLVI